MEERWLVIEENPKYKVSNLGNVMGPKGLRKPVPINTYGHVAICWRHNGKIVQRYVHRLVLHYFVGPCPEGQEVLHLDGDPSNNQLENLTYGTHLQNSLDGKQTKLTEDDVRLIRSGNYYQWELCDHLGISGSSVYNIQTRRSHKHIM